MRVPATASRTRILAPVRLLNREIETPWNHVTHATIPAHGAASAHGVIPSRKASGSMRMPDAASLGRILASIRLLNREIAKTLENVTPESKTRASAKFRKPWIGSISGYRIFPDLSLGGSQAIGVNLVV